VFLGKSVAESIKRTAGGRVLRSLSKPLSLRLGGRKRIAHGRAKSQIYNLFETGIGFGEDIVACFVKDCLWRAWSAVTDLNARPTIIALKRSKQVNSFFDFS